MLDSRIFSREKSHTECIEVGAVFSFWLNNAVMDRLYDHLEYTKTIEHR